MSVSIGGLGIQAAQSPAKPIVERCWDHAVNNLYFGPPAAGDMLAGWPVDDLINIVAPSATYVERARIKAEMQSRYGGGRPLSPPYIDPAPARPYTLEDRLAMRMQWGRPEDSKWAPGFTHVALHRGAVGSTTIHVWIITTNGQSVVLEDEAPLFPSDALITKLNTIKD